jgi:hypothetical protein
LLEFNIVHASRPSAHPHAFSAASRACETQLALLKLNFRNDCKLPQGYVVAVKDMKILEETLLLILSARGGIFTHVVPY